MPITQPSVSWTLLRNFMEKFSWRDAGTGLSTTGYNPPAGAADVRRVPFYVKYVTGQGVLEMGNAVSLKVNRRRHQRMIMFVDSREIRWIRDYLVVEVDGMRVVTH